MSEVAWSACSNTPHGSIDQYFLLYALSCVPHTAVMKLQSNSMRYVCGACQLSRGCPDYTCGLIERSGLCSSNQLSSPSLSIVICQQDGMLNYRFSDYVPMKWKNVCLFPCRYLAFLELQFSLSLSLSLRLQLAKDPTVSRVWRSCCRRLPARSATQTFLFAATRCISCYPIRDHQRHVQCE